MNLLHAYRQQLLRSFHAGFLSAGPAYALFPYVQFEKGN